MQNGHLCRTLKPSEELVFTITMPDGDLVKVRQTFSKGKGKQLRVKIVAPTCVKVERD